MIARVGSGWQYVLTDLSLILFMTTAAALSQADGDAPSSRPAPPSQRAEPLAVWRAAPGAPPLAQWLASQGADPRDQLTIVARYPAGKQAQAFDAARELATASGTRAARIVIEPGQGELTASLAFDAPDPVLARPLLVDARPDTARKAQP